MNTSAQIYRFLGPVRREAGPGTAAVSLIGRLVERDGSGIPAQLALIGSASEPLPSAWTDLSVDVSAAPEVVLRAGGQVWRMHCKTWQLHRDVGRVFYAAIPPRPTPWKRRLGWRVLLGIAATAPGRWMLSRRNRAR